MKLIEFLKELLFPRKCILCRRLLPKSQAWLCDNCQREAPWFPGRFQRDSEKLTLHFLDSYSAVWYYEGDVRRSLLRFKFRGSFALSRGFGYCLRRTVLSEHPDGFDAVTWVPVSKRRKWRRGYDQAELLAKELVKGTDWACFPLLIKAFHNPPQSSLRAQERKGNVLGVYKCIRPELIYGKRILLVDDIVTTGATAEECARVLLTAGAESVTLAAVAGTRTNKTKGANPHA